MSVRGMAPWSALLAFALAGCSSDATTESTTAASAAIKGGIPDTTSTEVVAIFRETVPIVVSSVCTGTLIAPNVVVTARHCIEDHTGLGCATTFSGTVYPHVWVTTAADSGSSGKKLYKAASVVRPNTDSTFCGNDVALIVLSEVIPATEATPRAPLIGAAMSPGAKFSAIGYGGVDASGTNDGSRQRFDSATTFCVGSDCGFGEPREWLGTAPLCPGDSGGPALDTAGQVVGVASRGDCNTAVYQRLECFAEFLKSNVKTAASSGGYAAPAWTDLPDGTPSPSCTAASGTGGAGSGGTTSFGGAAGVGGGSAGSAAGGFGGSGATSAGGSSSGGASASGGAGGGSGGKAPDAGVGTPPSSGGSGSCAYRALSRDRSQAWWLFAFLLLASIARAARPRPVLMDAKSDADRTKSACQQANRGSTRTRLGTRLRP